MALLLALFFLSGAAGLIYEVVWTRMLADVVGSTAVSMTAVFSIYLAGLATGAGLFGRARARGSEALRLYGLLEIGAAATALAVTLLLRTQGHAFAAVAPAPDRFGAGVAYAVALTAALIGVPTILLGGTLPVMLNALAGRDRPRSVVTAMYGWNTVGAAVGAVLAGFWLILWLGLTATTLVAASVGLGVGWAALVLAGRGWAEAPGVPDEPEPDPAVAEEQPPGADPAVGGGAVSAGWLLLALLSGAAVLALEVLWGRIARFVLGDRTQAISALLFVFILALGCASLAAPALARWLRVGTRERTTGLLGGLLLFGAALHALVVPLAAATVKGGGLAGLSQAMPDTAARLVIVALLVGPPIATLGLVFPLLAWSARHLDDAPGRVLGRLYLWNTTGAVAGAVVASFLLARWTGTLGGFAVVCAPLATVGAALLAIRWRAAVPRLGLAVVVVAAVTLALWRPGDLIRLLPGEALVDAREDEYGVQVLARTHDGYLRLRNNRVSLIYDLGDPSTTHAQQMAAHLSTLFADGSGAVLNIGTGYGITAGAYTLYDGWERIVSVEILPFLLDLQPIFQPYNLAILDDPRVRLELGDGRHVLQSSDDTWDVISVNVLDPYLPGSASLYTTDFWREARDRLRPGGVYTQLVWGEDVPLLVKGLESVFPTVLYFDAYDGTSFNVIAFRDPVGGSPRPRLDRLTARARTEIEALEGGSPEAVMVRLLAEAAEHGARLRALARAVSGPLHTDDRPVLEYRWAHGVGGVSGLDSPLVEN